MLVLARKLTEVIQIGDDIVIKVLQIQNGVVRIGIDAPNSVRILRGELLGSPTPTPAETVPVDAAPLAKMVRARRPERVESGSVLLRRVDVSRN